MAGIHVASVRCKGNKGVFRLRRITSGSRYGNRAYLLARQLYHNACLRILHLLSLGLYGKGVTYLNTLAGTTCNQLCIIVVGEEVSAPRLIGTLVELADRKSDV